MIDRHVTKGFLFGNFRLFLCQENMPEKALLGWLILGRREALMGFHYD
jgi:hypothetical protein